MMADLMDDLSGCQASGNSLELDLDGSGRLSFLVETMVKLTVVSLLVGVHKCALLVFCCLSYLVLHSLHCML